MKIEDIQFCIICNSSLRGKWGGCKTLPSGFKIYYCLEHARDKRTINKSSVSREVDDYYTPRNIGFYQYEQLHKKSEVDFHDTFHVTIKAKAYDKLFSYVRAVDLEISGLGIVNKIKGGYEIEDVMTFKQRCSAAYTDLNRKAISNTLLDLVKQNRHKDTKKIKLWWHSHVHMGTFWSGTDDATCLRLANDDYWVSIVVNHEKQIKCRVELAKPFRMSVDDVPFETDGTPTNEPIQEFINEAKAKVKPYVFHWNNKYYKWNKKKEKMSKYKYPIVVVPKRFTPDKERNIIKVHGDNLPSCNFCKRHTCLGCRIFTNGEMII